jgi:hypothetical protein
VHLANAPCTHPPPVLVRHGVGGWRLGCFVGSCKNNPQSAAVVPIASSLGRRRSLKSARYRGAVRGYRVTQPENTPIASARTAASQDCESMSCTSCAKILLLSSHARHESITRPAVRNAAKHERRTAGLVASCIARRSSSGRQRHIVVSRSRGVQCKYCCQQFDRRNAAGSSLACSLDVVKYLDTSIVTSTSPAVECTVRMGSVSVGLRRLSCRRWRRRCSCRRPLWRNDERTHQM